MAVVAIYPYQTLKPYLSHLTFVNNRTYENSVYSNSNPLGLFSYFLSTVYILLFLGGAIGNVWAISVIVSLFKHRSQEPPRNVQLYILVLCVIDIFVLLFMPFTIGDAFYGQWTLLPSPIMCKLYLCSELLNKFFAPFILMALSGTCYMVVCKRQCRGFPDDLRAGFSIVTLAVGVLIVLMAPVYVNGGLHYVVVFDQPDSNGTSVVEYLALKCMFQMSKDRIVGDGRISDFILYTFAVGYVAPATAFTVFYLLLWQYVRRHSWRARSLVNSWRVARTVLGLVSFFLLCWSPYWAVLLYSNARPQYKAADRNPITLGLAYITHLLPYINCLGYPLIYIMLNRKIKENYEMIRAKRRSQIMALCGLRKGACGRRESKKRAQKGEIKAEIANHNLIVPADPKREKVEINEFEEPEDPRLVAASVTSRVSPSDDTEADNGSRNRSVSSGDSQSLFANVSELMELSRHLLIPLIEISDAAPVSDKEQGVGGKHVDLNL